MRMLVCVGNMPFVNACKNEMASLHPCWKLGWASTRLQVIIITHTYRFLNVAFIPSGYIKKASDCCYMEGTRSYR